ncbi:unnamed protein product [Linum trigynum]|uniref:Uncharacterized protein n=1 Tax=Linum trigynum TaxID=586398 RepID=A0AAV2G4H6_9ROSI
MTKSTSRVHRLHHTEKQTVAVAGNDTEPSNPSPIHHQRNKQSPTRRERQWRCRLHVVVVDCMESSLWAAQSHRRRMHEVGGGGGYTESEAAAAAARSRSAELCIIILPPDLDGSLRRV